MKDGNPSNKQNWKIVCSLCGAEFEDDEIIDLAHGHYQEEHPEEEGIHFHTVWVGKGPEPRGNRLNKRRRR